MLEREGNNVSKSIECDLSSTRLQRPSLSQYTLCKHNLNASKLCSRVPSRLLQDLCVERGKDKLGHGAMRTSVYSVSLHQEYVDVLTFELCRLLVSANRFGRNSYL